MAGKDTMIALDSTHSRAICDEIGERLRDALGQETAEVPSFLSRLVDRLAELDRVSSPSIVPDIDDVGSGDAATSNKRELA